MDIRALVNKLGAEGAIYSLAAFIDELLIAADKDIDEDGELIDVPPE